MAAKLAAEGFRVKEEMMSEGKRPNWSLWISYALGAAVAGACLWIGSTIDQWSLNVAIIVFGFALGWNIGMLLSPKLEAEQKAFVVYGKAITAFLGGFLIAKLDAAFGGNALSGIVADPVGATRFLLFGIMFLLGLQCTYVGRMYSMWLTD